MMELNLQESLTSWLQQVYRFKDIQVIQSEVQNQLASTLALTSYSSYDRTEDLHRHLQPPK